MIDQGWTEQGLRDALRRSDEFRQRNQPPAPTPQTPPRDKERPTDRPAPENADTEQR